MTYTNTEVTDAAREKFSFLIDDYGFTAIDKEARGTYLSQILFESNHLEMFIGVWGQGNEFWFTLKPLVSKDIPAFELEDILNGITNDACYFAEHISKKTQWPISTHTFPQYFEVCAFELRNHCEKIFAGDLSQWIDIVRNMVNQRVERSLSVRRGDESLELDAEEKKKLEPLVVYVRSIDPAFSLSEVQYNILDKLTR